jgi:hypothetical protein
MRIDENGHFDNNNYKISPNSGLITRERERERERERVREYSLLSIKNSFININGQILSSNTTSSDDIVCVFFYYQGTQIICLALS